MTLECTIDWARKFWGKLDIRRCKGFHDWEPTESLQNILTCETELDKWGNLREMEGRIMKPLTKKLLDLLKFLGWHHRLSMIVIHLDFLRSLF